VIAVLALANAKNNVIEIDLSVKPLNREIENESSDRYGLNQVTDEEFNDIESFSTSLIADY